MAGGRPPLPGYSGPRRRVLADAAALPGSPHSPHAGSRARPTKPLIAPVGLSPASPRLCHVLAAAATAAAARRPAAPHASRCRRRRHNTFPERNTSAERCRSAASRPARAAQGFIRREGWSKGPPPRRSPSHARADPPGTGPAPARLAPLPL